jgi:hypothetical protein
MKWRKATERQVGGNYTWWDSACESIILLPLLYCIGNAIPCRPLDYFLKGIFTDDEMAPGGGDPGWVWWRERQSDGSYLYYAWTDPEMSALEPFEASYDEITVKRYVRRTLENYAEAHPERQAEVVEVITKFGL